MSQVHLIETNDYGGSDLSYVALSHCWGQSPIIVLTKDNLNQFKDGIAISDLPKRFREAILIARDWLGMRYLWIDSMCILQDQLND